MTWQPHRCHTPSSCMHCVHILPRIASESALSQLHDACEYLSSEALLEENFLPWTHSLQILCESIKRKIERLQFSQRVDWYDQYWYLCQASLICLGSTLSLRVHLYVRHELYLHLFQQNTKSQRIKNTWAARGSKWYGLEIWYTAGLLGMRSLKDNCFLY